MKKMSLILILLLCATTLFACNARATEIVYVNEIVISDQNLYLAEGDTTVISAQVFPLNAFNQDIHWVSTDSNVVSVEDGFVVALGSGEAVLKAISDDGAYEDTCNVLVTTPDENLAANDFHNEELPLPEEYAENEIPPESSETPDTTVPDTTIPEDTTLPESKTTSQTVPYTANRYPVAKRLRQMANQLTLHQSLSDSLFANAAVPFDCFNPKKVMPSFASVFPSWGNNLDTTFSSLAQIQTDVANDMIMLSDDLEKDPEEYDTQVEKINGVTFVTVRLK